MSFRKPHFVVLVHGTREDAEAMRGEVADVLAPMGPRLSPAKSQVLHMSDGLDFLGLVAFTPCGSAAF